MPTHYIYHSPGAFSDEDMEEMAERITAIYVKFGLPAFYANIMFIPLEQKKFYVGGKPNVGSKNVRIAIEHVSLHIQYFNFFFCNFPFSRLLVPCHSTSKWSVSWKHMKPLLHRSSRTVD
jgi:hypothetical protein